MPGSVEATSSMLEYNNNKIFYALSEIHDKSCPLTNHLIR